MDKKKPGTDCGEGMANVSAALFELRDAFLELSLALKDLQFDTDLKQREEAARSLNSLLERVK